MDIEILLLAYEDAAAFALGCILVLYCDPLYSVSKTPPPSNHILDLMTYVNTVLVCFVFFFFFNCHLFYPRSKLHVA